MEIPTQVAISKISADLQSQLIRDLTAEADLERILDRAVEETQKALRASACAVFTKDPEGQSATQRAGSGYHKQFNKSGDIRVIPADEVPEEPAQDQRLGLTGWILSKGKPFLARSDDEVKNHPHLLRRQGQDLLAHAFLGVPIRGLDGDVIGVIKAERRLGDPEVPPEPFAISDELALETIARIANRCIHYADLARGGKGPQAVTAWARDVIQEAAATEGELDSLLDIVVNVTAAAMSADSCGIFLRDESGNTLTQRAGIGSQALREVIRSYSWPEEASVQECMSVSQCHPPTCAFRRDCGTNDRVGLTAWIARTGRSFYARNFDELRAHCHHRGTFDPVNFLEGTECGAFLGTPLQVGGRIIGVVKVENTSTRGKIDPRVFSPAARQRFELLAEDIALAIMRLQMQIPGRYRVIQEAQKTILEILRGGLRIPELVKKVVNETRLLFRAGACALFLKEGNELVQPPWAASGWAQRGPEIRRYSLVPEDAIKENPVRSDRVGLTVWIAVKQRKFTARSNMELKSHPHHRGAFDNYNFEEGERCESFMGFPLLIQEAGKTELIGVLKVESKMKLDITREYTYFNELDELVFGLIANSVAIAIQNARLLESRLEARLEADRVVAEGQGRERAWKEFSQLTAHRIGTEAAIIGGALYLLRRDLAAVSEAGRSGQHLADIAEAWNRINTMVHEFTRFATPPGLKLERLHVNQLCREVASLTEGVANLRVHLRLASDVPAMWGDRDRLQYTFKEMFQNAVKALSQHGGDLTVVTRSIDEGRQVRIEFIDTGPGVPLELKGRIFEPGFRARPGGTGLGLAIVQKTIGEHAGIVQETGTYGQGAHFVIELPVRIPAGAVAQRILIVDDSEPLRRQLEDVVTDDAPNREVVTASNEYEAARLINEQTFDLVITDVKLDEAEGTVTGGLHVLQMARQKDERIPVIVVSSHSKMEIPQSQDSVMTAITVEDEVKRLGCIALIERTQLNYIDTIREAVSRALKESKDQSESAQAPEAGI